MKRIFTLLISALLLTAGANAQDRKWDFTNWSESTKALIKADAVDAQPVSDKNTPIPGWRDFEKYNGTVGEHADEAYWWGETSTGTESKELAANGTIIEETAGLKWTALKAGNLAIAFNYPSTSLGDYAGPQYLWIGGSSLSFVIPDVKVGSKITIEVESHKPAEGRGVAAYVDGKEVAPIEGSTKPKEKTTCVWKITQLAAGDAEMVDVTFTNNNGCHLYSITVEESKSDISNAKMAYIFDSQYPGYNADADVYRLFATSNDRFSAVTTDVIDLSQQQPDFDALTAYDLVIVSGAIAADNAYAATLKSVIGYTPMLNLNGKLYATWGYGAAKEGVGTSVTVAENYLDNKLFKPFSQSAEPYVAADGTLKLLTDGSLTAVELNADGYFAADRVYATAGDAVAIHAHSLDRNAYLYMPYNFESQDFDDNIQDIFTNAIAFVVNTKTEIPQTAAPTFTLQNRNLNTDVSLKCATAGAKIYYTIDGSEPTEASTLFTEKFNIATEGVTVKAVAKADGYSLSAVAEQEIKLYTASLEPTIAVAYKEADGKPVAEVTITAPSESEAVYYNLSGNNVETESERYIEPFTVDRNLTLFAFTGASDDKIASGTVEQVIAIPGKRVRENVLSHFDGNAADWRLGGEGTSATYYPSDNKGNGWEFYNSVEVGKETVIDAEGNEADSIIYEVSVKDSLYLLNPGKGWEYKSYGQGGNWQTNNIVYDMTKTAADKVYRPETVFDLGASKGEIRMHNVKKSDLNHPTQNDPYSACLQTTEAFQGPFDVTVFLTNGSSNNHPRGIIYVSKDTLDVDAWEQIDTVWTANTQRWHRRTTVSYNGTDKVFVKLQAAFSSLCVNDIIITNDPEETIEDGIADRRPADAILVRTESYSVGGTRVGNAHRGITIVRRIYADGSQRTEKVVRQ